MRKGETMSAPAPLLLREPPKEWPHFASVFRRLGSPLRPSPGDVDRVRRAIAGRDARVLLLGVTPELSVLGKHLFAIDNSPRMITQIWPGDSARCQAMLGDWADLQFDAGSFDAVIGDGSLNSAPERLGQVLAEARRVLATGGKAVFRLFCSPEAPETLSAIRREVEAGRAGNVHALKWRIAMTLAASMPGAVVPVRTILAAFNEMFPDRIQLSTSTGWTADEIATLDAYVGAEHSLAFPTLLQMLAMAEPFFSGAAVRRGSGYPLAERCPTVVWSAG
jgi:SAM-dependent methyltransferase